MTDTIEIRKTKQINQTSLINQACEVTLKDLLEMQYLVKNLKLKNNYKAKALTSDNITKNIGRGMEYAESRIYQPGDDVRHIDWRLSARHSKTYTKLFHEEKGENNYIILDLSDSLYFGTKYYLKSVIAAKIASLIAWLGFYENNNVGCIIFNNKKLEYLKPKLNKNNIISIINLIVNLHKPKSLIENRVENGINTDQNNLYTAINKFEHLFYKNSRVFIISDFLSLNDNVHLLNKIQQLNYKHALTTIRVADVIEQDSLINGTYNISNGLNSTSITIDNNNQEVFKEFFAKKLQDYNKLIKKLNINHLTVYSKPKWYYELINKL